MLARQVPLRSSNLDHMEGERCKKFSATTKAQGHGFYECVRYVKELMRTFHWKSIEIEKSRFCFQIGMSLLVTVLPAQ